MDPIPEHANTAERNYGLQKQPSFTDRGATVDMIWQLKMNTNEISEYLNRDLICSKIFYGVYPANKIPKLRSLPALIVCNTDTSSRPGEHWIVLYVDENYRGEYFDSMGRFQTKWFKTFLEVNCTAWIWNDKQLQSLISKLC